MQRITPLLWLLFSAGGTVAALLFPVHLFLTGLAFPLGWLEAPDYDHLHRLLTHPVIRLYLFVLISLPLFHCAHRRPVLRCRPPGHRRDRLRAVDHPVAHGAEGHRRSRIMTEVQRCRDISSSRIRPPSAPTSTAKCGR